jgi:hypothetical protein
MGETFLKWWGVIFVLASFAGGIMVRGVIVWVTQKLHGRQISELYKLFNDHMKDHK